MARPTIRRPYTDELLFGMSVFDHFAGLALKGLINDDDEVKPSRSLNYFLNHHAVDSL